MTRGRPKKSNNKEELTITKKDITEPVKEPTVDNKIKTYKSTSFCDLCSKEIFGSPNVINLSILTGKASWHRDCKKDRLSICNECAKELNTLVDKFVIKKNKSLKKFS